jgi:predicted AAA+ superfamily ATPase
LTQQSNSPISIVLTGLRRVGKSTLLRQIIQKLMKLKLVHTNLVAILPIQGEWKKDVLRNLKT